MNDEYYMRRAIELAKKGLGFTNPNPLVGAVIVKDGEIIGEGYHAKYGELHAERNAIASLKKSAKGATIYVTLEPCCHYGKTPPCTEAILEQGIKRVVIGSRDPNPKVAGKGAQILRNAGVIVEEDFLCNECDKLNDVFFHYITTKTPYVVSKYAMSADGKIATVTKASKWISNEKSRMIVQKMRATYMGIMVGIGTVLADNPMLNVRLSELSADSNLQKPRNPIRIICDSRLRIPLDCNICKTANEIPTIVVYSGKSFLIEDKTVVIDEADLDKSFGFGESKSETAKHDSTYSSCSLACFLEDKKNDLEKCGIELIESGSDDGHIDLNKLMKILGKKGIDSILLEGGGTLNFAAFEAGIVNEVNVFVAPKIIGGSSALTPVEGKGVLIPDEAFMLELKETAAVDEDLLIKYNVKRKTI